MLWSTDLFHHALDHEYSKAPCARFHKVNVTISLYLICTKTLWLMDLFPAQQTKTFELTAHLNSTNL